MEAGVTTTTTTTTASFSSILDKPLSQLTEEDISQLTREDCRKFLKEKGMRRPSWNKSQAIQQVISLKALLESNDDSGAGALRKILVSPPPPSVSPQNAAARVASNSGDSVKEGEFGEEESPYRRKDPPLEPAPVGEINCRGGDTDNKNLSPRRPCETNELGGQMTIFYCGKVNVYDGVPLDKARAIMQLAANPIDFPQDNICSGNAALRSFVCNVQAASDKNGLIASDALNSHTMQTENMAEYQQQFGEEVNITRDSDVEGQVNRKLSLQRYLEKRKDRFLKGGKNIGQTSTSLEMYLNHQIRNHNSNGQSSRSSTSSPPQSVLPHAFCSSTDNQAKLANLSVDLNDESVQEL
ncbi:protein TIFY 4B-like [Durio zibethinus]|uniref:Protein TIFY n=1 Tax=Durio zibethinus TaxID=66656 RepID=A0A6P6A833_DURZI|nr:protein TIFY 4B-like [Durio zibethinus]